MKKLIIASAIILVSGVTALSLNKPATMSVPAVDAHTLKSDMASKTTAGIKEDVGIIQ